MNKDDVCRFDAKPEFPSLSPYRKDIHLAFILLHLAASTDFGIPHYNVVLVFM
jgi:hypothetical protein